MSPVAHTLLDAAIGEESWPRALAGLATSYGGFESNFLVYDRARSRVAFSAWADFRDVENQGYARCENIARSRAGQVILTQNLPEQVFLRDDIYNDFLRPLGTRYIMGLKLADCDSNVAMLRIHRGGKSGPYSSTEARRFRLALPGLAYAARIHLNRLHVARREALAASVLDRLNIAVIVIDRQQRVLHANALAQDILAEGSILAVQDGLLAPRCAEAGTALRRSIDEACDGAGDSLECAALGLQCVSTGGYELSISPFAGDGSLLLRPAVSEAFLVTLKRVERQFNNLAAKLRNGFGLTASEASIVEQIMQGRTLQEIASENAISINTVKTHLKAIFVKMDVRSQADLIRVILSDRLAAS